MGDVKIGIVVTTIGRAEISDLIDSLIRSDYRPEVMCISNQSGFPLASKQWSRAPFPIILSESSGGISCGRNDAWGRISDAVDVIGIPNDDSILASTALAKVAERFDSEPSLGALAGSNSTWGVARTKLPAGGTSLNRKTIWRAIEPAMFLADAAIADVGGFDTTIGSGCSTPWQSGEGTDLLLRVLDAGYRISSEPSVQVDGPGERRNLNATEYRAKVRRYARGTGYLYRTHRYGLLEKSKLVLAPTARLIANRSARLEDVGFAWARTIGRIEGVTGAIVPRIGRRT